MASGRRGTGAAYRGTVLKTKSTLRIAWETPGIRRAVCILCGTGCGTRKKRMQPLAAFLRGEFMKKFYLLSNEVMSGGTSFDEFSISRNCVHLVSEK